MGRWRGRACRLDIRQTSRRRRRTGAGRSPRCRAQLERIVVRQFVEALRHWPEPQHLEPAPLGVCPEVKRLVKADEQKREAFVAECHPVGRGEAYGSEDIQGISGPMRTERQMGAEGRAGFGGRPARAMRKGQLLLGSVETGEVEWMDLEGNSNSGTSAAFLERLRQRYSGPLNVIWDNAPAHAARRCVSICGHRAWGCG